MFPMSAKAKAPSKTLNAANLARLPAERLAALLIEVSEGQPAIKRRLRLELAGQVGAEDLAAELDKRIAQVAERKSRITWRKYREFVRELDQLRAAIVGPMAEQNPFVALELLWRFIGLPGALGGLLDDGKGEAQAVIEAAIEGLGPLAVAAKAKPEGLADRVFEAITADEMAVTAGLVAGVLPALDPLAMITLRDRIEQVMNRRARTSVPLRRAVQQIADAQGDIEGYIATWSPKEQTEAMVGAAIARRLLDAGRAAEALAALDRSRPTGPVRTRSTADWEEAWLAALEATGRAAEAQEMRWAAFEERLDPDLLRAHLKRLPDFDDVIAEDRAMAHARAFPNAVAALRFFIAWPAYNEAAALVMARHKDIKGDAFDLLEPAARGLEGRHPLAATLLLRAMIEDVARYRRNDHYKDALRWLLEAASLEPQIRDHQGFGTHDDFLKRIAPMRRF